MNSGLQHPIVLVDDEKSYTDLLSETLSRIIDRPVVGFTRPLDALTALPNLQPAVVVTDYHMPQISGVEFVRLGSVVVPEAVFIMISGHNLHTVEDQLARFPQLKVYLSKPMGVRMLADEIIRVWPQEMHPPTRKIAAAS